MKRNSFLTGAILGVIFPLIAFALIYIFWFYDSMPFDKFMTFLWLHSSTFSGVLSLSIILNLPVFLFNIRAQRNETSKGIIFSTLLFGACIIYLKLIR
jgi:hypothetical protein